MGIKVDLHNHSRHGSPDGMRSYDEIAAECDAKGIDVAVITEHDKTTDLEALEEVSGRHSVLLLPGVELSYPFWGHFVVLGGETILKRNEQRTFDKHGVVEMIVRAGSKLRGIPGDSLTFNDFVEAMDEIKSLFKENNRLNPLEFCQAAQAHGAYVVWAHPFVGTPLRKELDKFLSSYGSLNMRDFVLHLKENHQQILGIVDAVDALEGFNGLEKGLTSFLAADFARELNKPTTAGSDGHQEWDYGTAYMEIACDRDSIKDVPSLIHALKTYDRTMHWHQELS